MAELVLEGCRVTPLSGYLSALGVHRAVHRLLDSEVQGCWNQSVYVLRCRFDTLVELTDALHARFEPESIVSPWNSGSGFAANGKSPAAERILQWVRESTDYRLRALRLAVGAGDRVVSEGHRLGISDLWDKKRKPEVLRLCRNELPDAAVAWLDAAIALGQDGNPSCARLLGTGGNLRRRELSVAYLQQVRTVLESSGSAAWLASALDGQSRRPLLRESLGQFDAGAVGASDEPNPVGNPWTFLLVIEGALLFATAVVRRYGAAYSGAALPFQVAGSTAGFASSASAERPLAELWAPEWPDPLSIPEVAHLLAEGRADWNSHAARSGLDMARSAATLGVDRGIRAFHRHVFVDRLGQSPIAVPAGRIEVGVRGGVDLLAPLDRWREALRRINLPSDTAARLRALDQAIFDHAATGQPGSLVEVFAALGRCRSTVSRSRRVREVKLPALSFPHGAKLFDQLRDVTHHDRELRIALALATSRDETSTFGTWLKDRFFAGGLAAGLADIARRRGFPLATKETVIDCVPSVRGARIVFERGMSLRAGDVQAFVDRAIDDERTAALTLSLSCVDWRHTGNEILPGSASMSDPALDLLLLFTGAAPLGYSNADGERRSLFVRPGHEWPSRLIAGHVPAVLQDASRRLRIAGVRHVVGVPGAPYEGTRLAAMLLLTTTNSDRRAALSRVAVVGTHRTELAQEVIT
ncbi:type I-U CRISPR-associated protein Csx17 [Mycobacterium sp. SM1]|uniref:type I-G CRISPR-associated protein Cas8g1/Csx17 n=1 Tax=Mycobacterium sp. SM1 TaxID=2816243 RepID=UPI001BD0C025|nr:type I-U CRISPR-associated protein Csx17 [Mycobacterium sp. SM1]MBS4729900.1 type I-U CRISPR-associated protein Csx17 [Mycobacterium sp. SM1]